VAALLQNERKAELIADGIYIHPAVKKLLYNIDDEGGIVLITDAIRASGMPYVEYTLRIKSLLFMRRRRTSRMGHLPEARWPSRQ